jgi:hypothetical protein
MTNLSSRYDLSSSPFALCGTFDNSRQIQYLNFRSFVLQDSRYSRKCCEGVGGYLAFGLGDLGQEGGLAYRREPHKCDSSIAALTDIKAGTASRTGARCRL